jgi:hypothetical protein
MPANEHFRCPACRAKLKFGRRPKSRVTCPRCGHQFDYKPTAEGSEGVAQQGVEPGSDPLEPAPARDELGGTAAFGLALKEVTGGSSGSDAEDELDVIDDEGVDASPPAKGHDEYGPATAPLRPRKPVARVSDDPPVTTQRPLSKRLRKWYKRSALSNPSTGGWQIAAGYAGLGVIVLVALLGLWMRGLQSQATSEYRSSYATVYKDSASNVANLALTGVFSVGTMFCLPIPYGLWVGSSIGRYAWLFVRGVGYVGWLIILPGILSGCSSGAMVGCMGLLVVTAISNLVGCVLLTTEGTVGRTVFAGVLIVGSELVAIGLFLLSTGGLLQPTADQRAANLLAGKWEGVPSVTDVVDSAVGAVAQGRDVNPFAQGLARFVGDKFAQATLSVELELRKTGTAFVRGNTLAMDLPPDSDGTWKILSANADTAQVEFEVNGKKVEGKIAFRDANEWTLKLEQLVDPGPQPPADHAQPAAGRPAQVKPESAPPAKKRLTTIVFKRVKG